MKKISRKGFTLIELLIVIAIIGILASVVLVSLNSARVKARSASFKAQASSVHAAVILECDKGAAADIGANVVLPTGTAWGTIATCDATGFNNQAVLNSTVITCNATMDTTGVTAYAGQDC